MISGFVIGVLTSLIAFLAMYIYLRFFGGAKERRADLLEKMQGNYHRLQDALVELLAKADEADQETKYLSKGSELEPELSKRLSRACSELVVLGDKIKLIEAQLAREDAKGASRDILKTLGTANQLSAELKKIRQEIKQLRDAS